MYDVESGNILPAPYQRLLSRPSRKREQFARCFMISERTNGILPTFDSLLIIWSRHSVQSIARAVLAGTVRGQSCCCEKSLQMGLTIVSQHSRMFQAHRPTIWYERARITDWGIYTNQLLAVYSYKSLRRHLWQCIRRRLRCLSYGKRDSATYHSGECYEIHTK